MPVWPTCLNERCLELLGVLLQVVLVEVEVLVERLVVVANSASANEAAMEADQRAGLPVHSYIALLYLSQPSTHKGKSQSSWCRVVNPHLIPPVIFWSPPKHIKGTGTQDYYSVSVA